MSKQIDIIKRIKVKNSLKRGNSAKQALLDGDYSKATAHHSTGMTVVKRCQEEIMQELRAKDLGVDYFLNKSEMILQKALDKKDLTNATRNLENQAKFAGVDKPVPNITNIQVIQNEGTGPQALTERLLRRKNVNIPQVGPDDVNKNELVAGKLT